jgi:4-hydroxybenzoate polyprenyltransferase
VSPIRRRLRAYLQLGRVSNLPTVWTNVIAGAALATSASSRPATPTLVTLGVVLATFYVAGMFLNDAFDHGIDARERPERPIPSGVVSAAHVFRVGFGLLAAAVAALALLGGVAAALGGVALAAAIVLYDVRHKGNPLGPLVMAACRALVYVVVSLALTGSASTPVLVGAAVLFAYVASLTLVAKHAGGRVVAPMIAGISLLDAAVVAVAWSPLLALVVALGFPATLRLQRRVRGT